MAPFGDASAVSKMASPIYGMVCHAAGLPLTEDMVVIA